MNDKYHITPDGYIFEILPDGSMKKLGSVADGELKSYDEISKGADNTPKVGTLSILYDGYWTIVDARYELYVNDKHFADFSFKKPFRFDIPIEQSEIKIKVKKWFYSNSFEFSVDPEKDHIAYLTYNRRMKWFNLTVRDENNNKVYKKSWW